MIRSARSRRPFASAAPLLARCLADHHAMVQMPRGRANADCRQDYLCAAAEDDTGICAPPYVLHQLTIENHPLR